MVSSPNTCYRRLSSALLLPPTNGRAIIQGAGVGNINHDAWSCCTERGEWGRGVPVAMQERDGGWPIHADDALRCHTGDLGSRVGSHRGQGQRPEILLGQ